MMAFAAFRCIDRVQPTKKFGVLIGANEEKRTGNLAMCGASSSLGCRATGRFLLTILIGMVSACSVPAPDSAVEVADTIAPNRIGDLDFEHSWAVEVSNPTLQWATAVGLAEQVLDCWTPPRQIDHEAAVKLKIYFGSDGNVQSEVAEHNTGDDRVLQAMADSAREAVTRCGRFDLPDQEQNLMGHLKLEFRYEDNSKRFRRDVEKLCPQGCPIDTSGPPNLVYAMEIIAVKQTLDDCWRSEPRIVGDPNTVVRLRIEIAQDGFVKQVTIEDDDRAENDPVFRSVSESAKRAMTKCGPVPISPEWAQKGFVINLKGEDAVARRYRSTIRQP